MEDARGNLGLSKQCREFLCRLLRLKVPPWILFWDTDRTQALIQDALQSDPATRPMELDGPTPAEAAGIPKSVKGGKRPFCLGCVAYMKYLQQTQLITSEVERYGTGYQDFLQVPLQVYHPLKTDSTRLT